MHILANPMTSYNIRIIYKNYSQYAMYNFKIFNIWNCLYLLINLFSLGSEVWIKFIPMSFKLYGCVIFKTYLGVLILSTLSSESISYIKHSKQTSSDVFDICCDNNSVSLATIQFVLLSLHDGKGFIANTIMDLKQKLSSREESYLYSYSPICILL